MERRIYLSIVIYDYHWKKQIGKAIGSMRVNKLNDLRISKRKVGAESQHVERRQTSTMTDLTRTDEENLTKNQKNRQTSENRVAVVRLADSQSTNQGQQGMT